MALRVGNLRVSLSARLLGMAQPAEALVAEPVLEASAAADRSDGRPLAGSRPVGESAAAVAAASRERLRAAEAEAGERLAALASAPAAREATARRQQAARAARLLSSSKAEAAARRARARSRRSHPTHPGEGQRGTLGDAQSRARTER